MKTTNGETIPETVEKAIRASFDDAETILAELSYSPLWDNFVFFRYDMLIAVERDGYVHS